MSPEPPYSSLPRITPGEILHKRVKTVIKSKTTGQYLEADGSWTGDVTRAAGFADTMAVIAAVQHHHLIGVDMVIIMGDEPSKYDSVVALSDFRGSQPGQSTAEGHSP